MAIKICPICTGKPWNDVFTRIFSKSCELCGGKGQIDTSLMCRCGRPAVESINNIKVCTRIDCQKVAFERKEA